LPQGPPAGFVLPGVFGLIVDGVVPFPGVGGLVELDPGTVDGVPFGELVLGVAVLPGGVAVEPGGVEGDPGGVAVLPAGAWPAAPALPAGEAPPAGALCATNHIALKRTVEIKVSFVSDI
jgi:hypothetical protein